MKSVTHIPFTCISALALCGVLSVSASAATIIYDRPAADTYVSNGGSEGSQSGTNYGTETTWRTRYTNHNSSNRKGYVRFDLDGKLTATVESATLTLRYVSQTNAEGTSTTLQVYGLNHDFEPTQDQLGLDWSETQLTNNNAPFPAKGGSTPPSYVTLLGSITIPVNPAATAGTEFSFSTPELASFLETFRLSGEDNVTFIFLSAAGTFFSFASKENTSYAPTSLTVVTASSNIPEASSFTVVAGAAVAAFCATMRRRGRH